TPSPTSPGTSWTTNRSRSPPTCGRCSHDLPQPPYPASKEAGAGRAEGPLGDAGLGLDPEGRARVVRVVEGRDLSGNAPRQRELPVWSRKEFGEEDRGAAAGESRTGREIDQVLALREVEGADVGARVYGEGSWAELAEKVVAAAFAAADTPDREGEAAAGERGLAGSFGGEAPRFRQVP